MKLGKKIMVFFSKRSRLKYKKENSYNTGLIIGESYTGKDNYRLMNLLVRSIVVLAVALGSIDGFMSAFGIGYDMQAVFMFLIAFNIFLTFIQINPLLRVGGYILAIWGAVNYYTENVNLIRSGINALTNLMYELVRIKFKLPEVHGFEEIVADRSITIPTLVIFVGCCYLIMLWEICGRTMNIIFTAMVSFAILSMGLYFDGVPSAVSVIMLAAAWILICCIKFNGKYRFSVSGKRQYRIFQLGEKQYIFRLLNGKAFAQLALLVCVFAAVSAAVLNTVISPESYEISVPQSELKEKTDVMIKDVMIIAFSKYKNFEVTGRVSNGQLGMYSSVTLDYEPDLEITYLPSTFEREYLKTFVGTDYSSRGWSTRGAPYDPDMTNATAAAAKAGGQPFNKIRIKNLDLFSSTPFLPYYTDIYSVPDLAYLNDVSIEMALPRGAEYEAVYYRDPDITIDDGKYMDYVYGNYLDVPDENRELITKLCEEQGWRGDDPEITEKIAKYFDDNYVYTLSPGLVPWKTDFVNYFLFENKEGLCAHFASAGTLIYRCLGIPARYVEGYALDYPLAAEEQTVLVNENAEDWYNGPTPLSSKPVKITLSDFSAHGWVEIYKNGYGWVPVELTPGADSLEIGDNKPQLTMAEQIMELLMTAGEDPEQTERAVEEIKNKTSDLGIYVLFVIVCILAAAVFVKFAKIVLKHAMRLNTFSKRNADSVIAIYSYIMEILVYKNKTAGRTHKDMAAALAPYMRSSETVVRTVEEMLYSPEGLPEDECENVFISLHGVLNKLLDEDGLIEKIKILVKI